MGEGDLVVLHSELEKDVGEFNPFMSLAPLTEGNYLFDSIPRLFKPNFCADEALFLKKGVSPVMVSGELQSDALREGVVSRESNLQWLLLR